MEHFFFSRNLFRPQKSKANRKFSFQPMSFMKKKRKNNTASEMVVVCCTLLSDTGKGFLHQTFSERVYIVERYKVRRSVKHSGAFKGVQGLIKQWYSTLPEYSVETIESG